MNMSCFLPKRARGPQSKANRPEAAEPLASESLQPTVPVTATCQQYSSRLKQFKALEAETNNKFDEMAKDNADIKKILAKHEKRLQYISRTTAFSD